MAKSAVTTTLQYGLRCQSRLLPVQSSAGPLGTILGYSTSATTSGDKKRSYKLVVVGGGTGGCAAAAMFSRKLGRGAVAVVEPSKVMQNI